MNKLRIVIIIIIIIIMAWIYLALLKVLEVLQ